MPEKHLNSRKVRRGNLMALVYWVQVEHSYNDGHDLDVRDLNDGKAFSVHGRELVEKSFSADVFESEEKVTKTELAEKLVNARNVPFTVEFEKADGSIRLLRGKLINAEPLMGRSHVYDLDVREGSPLRLVDHRTIQSLIVENVRYVLK